MALKLQMKPFRTRVARRVILLFIICSLGPVSVLATVSYWTVYTQLDNQSRERLNQHSKSLSLSFFERLLFFRSELHSVASVFLSEIEAGSLGSGEHQRTRKATTHFTGLGLLTEAGWEPFAGTSMEPPNPNLAQKDWLEKGHALLMLARRGNEHHLYMALQVTPHAGPPFYLIGEIDQSYIWEAAEGRPPGTELVLVDRTAGLLYGTISYNPFVSENPIIIPPDKHRGQVEWKFKGQKYLVGFKSIYLKSNFANPDWVVLLMESHEHIFAPMNSFKFTFPILIVMVVLLVFFLSLTLIHKILKPIEELRRGTEKLAAGKVGYRVDIYSGDEFETLGNGFNDMSDRLKEGQLLLARSSKLATVGQMSTGVLQELKQPLAGMDGMVQLLQMNANLADDDRKKLEHLKAGLERVQQTLERLVGFGQVSEERMRFLNLVELVNDVHGLLKHQLDEHGITYTFNHQKNLPLVYGDAHSLERVFSHLMINAIHALEICNDSERQLTVKTYQWGGKVVVEFIDNGCGMSKGVQTRIFDPFFTTKDPEREPAWG